MRLILVQPELDYSERDHNLAAVRRLLDASGQTFAPEDVLLLPEHWHPGVEAEAFDRDLRALARDYGLCVVGGSHHRRVGPSAAPSGLLNAGWVASATGEALGAYEKLRPYALERMRVAPGTLLGEVQLPAAAALVLVCADFWFFDLFLRANQLPDLVLVPALSVSRKAAPHYSRALWRHLAIARAYELGVFVGVSDWAHSSRLPALSASGVGGFVDPTGVDPERFFQPIPASGCLIVAPDLAALRRFRQDRAERGFFWKPVDPA